MSIGAAITILAFSMIFLIGSVIALAFEMRAHHRKVIALQLSQQMHTPTMAEAIDTVRNLNSAPSMNGHAPSMAQHALANGQWRAVSEVNRYFSHVGEMVRNGEADDEVFAMMGPTISEVWHASKSYRQQLADKANDPNDSAPVQDDFDYLYVEWLNYDYRRRAERGGLR